MNGRKFFIFPLIFIVFGTSKSFAFPVDTTAYLNFFLTSSDLPLMKNGQDSRTRGADQGDSAYVNNHGLMAGMNIWIQKGSSDTIDRLVDIHWVFPDAESAKKYLNETWSYQAEWASRINDAPNIGDMSRLYGFIKNMGGMNMVQYYYLFQVGRVVSKLFVSQNYQLKNVALTIAQVQLIALKSIDRIEKSGLK